MLHNYDFTPDLATFWSLLCSNLDERWTDFSVLYIDIEPMRLPLLLGTEAYGLQFQKHIAVECKWRFLFVLVTNKMLWTLGWMELVWNTRI